MTLKKDLPAGVWTEVVSDASADFLLENPNSYFVDIFIGATAPDNDSAYHRLISREGLVRVVSGKVWARPVNPNISTFVIVTV